MLIGRRLLIEFARGNSVLGAQIFRAVQLDLRKFSGSPGTLNFRRRAIEVGLIRPRIDHVKQIAFLDHRTGTDFTSVM